MRSHVSHVVSGCSIHSIRRLVSVSVSFAGHVAGRATSRLRQRNTRMSFHVPASSTSVVAQCRRQTDT